MSVASLETGNLTLNQLIISNSQYSNVSGYIPSQTIISSNSNSTQITSTSDITTTGGLLLGTGGGVLLTGTSNNLFIGGGNSTFNCGGLNCGTVVSTGDISTTGNLSVDGTLTLGSTGSDVVLSATQDLLSVEGIVSASLYMSTGSITLNNGTTSATIICAANSTIGVAAIELENSGVSGTLGINPSGQLTWNGVVIS